MGPVARKIFPLVVVGTGLLAVGWAISFGTLPQAEFSFANGDKIETVDPSKATGVPENRVINGLFEGLMRNLPVGEPNAKGTVDMKPLPAVAAAMPTLSKDRKVYTFKIRKDARWSRGYGPMTAQDFVWSWRRTLHPDTHSQYAYQLYYVKGAEAYNAARVKEGDHVEIEYDDRPNGELQPFPRGKMLRGVVKKIDKPADKPKAPVAPAKLADNADEAAIAEYRKLLTAYSKAKKKYQKKELPDWQLRWVYQVEVKQIDGASQVAFDQPGEVKVLWDQPGAVQSFSVSKDSATDGVQYVKRILPDFDSTVGVRADDDHTLVVTLNNPTPFFPSLTAFYTLYPVNRKCVEEFGSPLWTKPDNIVSNGPYTLSVRRLRDRIRLQKNPEYWNAKNVEIETIDAFPVQSQTTAINMYVKGQVDWVTDVPKTIISELQQREDFVSDLQLSTYFYRLNVTKKPFDNKLVRRALGLAINKKQIVEGVTKAGERPARNLVPPMPGYVPSMCGEYDPEKARDLLAKAGYPGGKGLPRIEILYNTSHNHKMIAEIIQYQWQETVGIDVSLRNLEWGVYLDSQRQLDYVVARAGWVADYPDPNTFLDMFVTGGGQNQTGWSNEEYDKLIKAAGAESDTKKRMEHFRKAEEILMDEMPIIPIYFYVSINIVKKNIKGFHANVLDQHPLQLLGRKKQ